MKKKMLFALLLSAMLVVAGCTSNAPASGASDTPSESSSAVSDEGESSEAETPDSRDLDPAAEDDKLAVRLEGLEENNEGLELTAAILPRMAILPGSTIPVTVTVKNTSEQDILYVQGSGSFTTPQALFLHSGDLQPILPEDQTGIATMDYRINTLAAGEELTFTMNVRAIAPNAEFDTYTYDLKMQEDQYIADLEWEELQAKYTDLEAVASGSYDVDIYFTYASADAVADGQETVTQAPNAFAKTTLTIGVA